MALLSVEDALARVLDAVEPTEVEPVAVERARGRVLAEPLKALLTQPPFTAAGMDGYAVRAADVAALPATLNVIGTAAAGHPFSGRITPGEAVRIFTGAPVPEGADAIVIQENADGDGRRVVVREGVVEPESIRPRGMDFHEGETLLEGGRRLGPRELCLGQAWATARCPCIGARAWPSSLRATSWCRPAPGRGPDRSSPPTTWPSRAWRRRQAQR